MNKPGRSDQANSLKTKNPMKSIMRSKREPALRASRHHPQNKAVATE